jgi:virulence-associated protein VapD
MTLNTSVVDVHTTKIFNEQHLKTSEHFINKDTRPEWYGPKFNLGKDLGRKLIPMSDVKWVGQYKNTQTARSAGGNTKYKDIKNSIHEFGFKLNNDPIALWQTDNGLYPITGYTRKDILEKLGFKNIIANVYDLKPENYSLLGEYVEMAYSLLMLEVISLRLFSPLGKIKSPVLKEYYLGQQTQILIIG